MALYRKSLPIPGLEKGDIASARGHYEKSDISYFSIALYISVDPPSSPVWEEVERAGFISPLFIAGETEA